MIINDWWAYVGIVAWALVLDSAAFYQQGKTWRFIQVPTGLLYLLIRSVACAVVGVLMPVLLTQDFKLDRYPQLVIFLAPLVTLSTLDALLGRAGVSQNKNDTNLGELLAGLRQAAVADAITQSGRAKQATDIEWTQQLSERFDSAQLERLLLDLLHTKMTTLQVARTKMSQLAEGRSTDELGLRHELATDILTIDRDFAKATLKALKPRRRWWR